MTISTGSLQRSNRPLSLPPTLTEPLCPTLVPKMKGDLTVANLLAVFSGPGCVEVLNA